MGRLTIRREVLRNLAIKSKDKCAFPGCGRPLINENNVYIGELCHIEAVEPGGQRYNSLSTDEERRSYDNLMFLCHEHHKETDDVLRYPVERLRQIKRNHEALPDVIFDSDLLLQKIEEVIEEQGAIKSILEGKSKTATVNNFPIVGPEIQEHWTPEQGRYYESRIGELGKFKYMMRDGLLHIEQTLDDGTVGYYEVDESGSVVKSRMPHPINHYRVVIPSELILNKKSVESTIGTHAFKTDLKWSKGSITEHFIGDVFVGADCNARCRISHSDKTITII